MKKDARAFGRGDHIILFHCVALNPAHLQFGNSRSRSLRIAMQRLHGPAIFDQCGGNKAQAARLLGMPRSTLFSKLRKHALT